MPFDWVPVGNGNKCVSGNEVLLLSVSKPLGGTPTPPVVVVVGDDSGRKEGKLSLFEEHERRHSRYLDETPLSKQLTEVIDESSRPPPSAASDRWSARWGHCTCTVGGALVLVGGDLNKRKEEEEKCWISRDGGATWIVQANGVPFHARSGARLVSYGDALVLTGGKDAEGCCHSDVWVSTDLSQSWRKLTDGCWEGRARQYHAFVSADGSLVVAGGCSSHGRIFSDVWTSDDGGRNWTLVCDSAPWGRRLGHSMVFVGGNLVLIGGFDGSRTRADVWTSADGGVTWRQACANCDWMPRMHSQAISYTPIPNGILLVGGLSSSDGGDRCALATTRLNDVWLSSDGGAIWRCVKQSEVDEVGASMPVRFGHSAALLDDVPSETADVHLSERHRNRRKQLSFIVITGGLSGGEALGDTWWLVGDGNEAREEAAMAKLDAAAAAAKTTAEREANRRAAAVASAEAAEEAKAKAEAEAIEEAEAEAIEEAKVKAEAEAIEEAKAKAEAEAIEEAKAKAEAEAVEEAKAKAEAEAVEEAKAQAGAEAAEEAKTEAGAEAVEVAKAAAEAEAEAEAEVKGVAATATKVATEMAEETPANGETENWDCSVCRRSNDAALVKCRICSAKRDQAAMKPAWSAAEELKRIRASSSAASTDAAAANGEENGAHQDDAAVAGEEEPATTDTQKPPSQKDGAGESSPGGGRSKSSSTGRRRSSSSRRKKNRRRSKSQNKK